VAVIYSDNEMNYFITVQIRDNGVKSLSHVCNMYCEKSISYDHENGTYVLVVAVTDVRVRMPKYEW